MSFPNYALYCKPVDRVAGRMSFGESDGWAPKMKEQAHIQTWDAPPKPEKDRPESAVDYTKARRGFMTAMYWYESGKRGSKWICRCDCGKYEFRTPKKWLEKNDVPDSCLVCQATHYALKGYSLQDTRDEKTIKREKAEAKRIMGVQHE